MSSWPAGWSQNVEGGSNLADDAEKAKVKEILAQPSPREEEEPPPPRWSAKVIRDTFVNYFKNQGHTHWPSSPVVPHEDPTLLFANAGMNQYKSIFLGASRE